MNQADNSVFLEIKRVKASPLNMNETEIIHTKTRLRSKLKRFRLTHIPKKGDDFV